MGTLVKVLRHPRYLVILITVTLTTIVSAAWLPNAHLVVKSVTSPTLFWWQKSNVLVALLGSLHTNFTPFGQLLIISSAILLGLQASLSFYYLRQSVKMHAQMGLSMVGIATSLLGIGCVSCGSVLLTSLIGFGTATMVIGLLPFRGQEFAVVGIAILLAVISFTIYKINRPLNCNTKSQQK